jgi:DNA modification methylase
MTPVPYWSDDQVSLYLGDALAVLREMPDASADCCVTSPPYYGLRDYGTEGQIGLEASPAEYVERLREVFAEVYRVLADDGTLWLNIGDSYYSGRGNPGPNAADCKQPARRGWVRPVDRPSQDWGTPKSLLGIPWRVAFALQDDGWTWRNVIPWHKPNAMPANVSDRLSNKWEPMLLFSKSRRYQFDLDAISEPLACPNTRGHVFGGANKGQHGGMGATERTRGHGTYTPKDSRNPGDFWEIGHDPFDEWWSITTTPFPGAHFAVFPVNLPIRCIRTTRPGATVLDPFSGAGTTGEACRRLGRRYVGIDLNPAYHDLAVKRYAQGVMDFPEASSA